MQGALRRTIFVGVLALFHSCAGFTGTSLRSGQVPSASAQKNGSITIPVPYQAAHEDLDQLRLTPGELQAKTPLLGEKDDEAKYTREMYQVVWRDGDPIDLFVIRPKGVEKPPAVLYLYSYPSEIDRFKDDGFCQRVTSGGVAAIGFVSALTGPRYHTRPMKEWFVSEMKESLVTSVHDVQMILNYLATRGDIDMNRIGMFGQGSGGTIAILAASVDSRIRAVDLLDPWADWPVWMAKSSIIPEDERANYLKPAFLKSIAPLDPVKVLPKLSKIEVRLEQCKDDTNTPLEAQNKLIAAGKPFAQSVRFDDTQSFFRTASAGQLFEWIKQQLKPAIATGTAASNAKT